MLRTAGLRIGADGAFVARHLEISLDDLIEGRSLRSGDFDSSIARRRCRHLRHDGGNVICGNRLKQPGRDVDDAVPLAFIDNGSEELHELG